jgi:hypothetical protein
MKIIFVIDHIRVAAFRKPSLPSGNRNANKNIINLLLYWFLLAS